VGILASGFTGVLPPLVRFLIAISVVSWIPGAALCQSWLPGVANGPLERAVLWLTTGLAVVSLLSWLSTLAGLSFDTYVIAVQWLLAVLFAAALAGRARPAATGIPPVEPVLDDGAQRAFIIVALVLAGFSAVYPARIEFHGDALDHIGYVRCIQSENSLDPGGVLAQTGDSVTKSDPRKGTIHDMAALVSRIADVDPAGVWSLLPVVLLPLAFLSFVWFCAVFVPTGFLVFFCAALFLLFQGGMGFLYGGEITNGQNVALLFYWTLVPLCFRFAATGARRVLVALVVVCAGGALIHIGLVVHFVILLATLLAFHRWCGLTARNVLQLCAWGGAAIAVVALWKWVHSVGPGNWIHVHPQGLLYVTGRFFVASPFEILRQYGLVFLGGLVFVPLLLFGVRNSRHARLNIAFSAIPYAICFCPLLAPFFYDHAAYMAFRSILNVPVYAAVVTGVYLVAAWTRRRWWPAKLLAALGLLVWSHLFLAPSLDAFARTVRRSHSVSGNAPAGQRGVVRPGNELSGQRRHRSARRGRTGAARQPERFTCLRTTVGRQGRALAVHAAPTSHRHMRSVRRGLRSRQRPAGSRGVGVPVGLDGGFFRSDALEADGAGHALPAGIRKG
jgi:hypothetical protein